MTAYVVPLLLCAFALYGISQKVSVFDAFMEGAGENAKVILRVLPSLVGLMTAVGMFKASGALDLLQGGLAPVASLLQIPREIIPLALLRPISGSGAMVIFQDVLQSFGPDSYIGRVASVLMGSTETTFYTLAVYYGVTHVKKTRHTLPSALSADLAGFVCSALLVRLFFGAAG